MSVSIICPVWNNANITQAFLFTNWRQYKNADSVNFVIVNNGSDDNTAEILARWQDTMGPRLTVITEPKNIGFGPANNRAAKVAPGRYLVFVNNDTVPTGDYVAPLIGELELRGKQSIIGAELINYDTGWNNFRPAGPIPYITGWCFAIRAEDWQQLGGFDERFVPCDYEDLDLSYRASQEGFVLVPLGVPIVHKFGKTAETLAGGREQITLTNQQKFMDKWELTPV